MIGSMEHADAYKAHEEAGCLYFFSRREYPRGDRGRPVRRTKVGGNWKASGGGKPVSTMKRGGVNVGYELTLDFYEKKSAEDESSGKTEWAMREYTRIIGPNRKVNIDPLFATITFQFFVVNFFYW